MPTNLPRIEELLLKQLEAGLSTQEEEELMAWVAASDDNRKAVEDLLNQNNFQQSLKGLFAAKEKVWNRVSAIVNVSNTPPPQIYNQHKRRFLIRFAAAASLLIVATSALFLYLQNNKNEKPIANANVKQDINAPINTQVTITLADGTVVMLDSLNAGIISHQGTADIVKAADGSLQYKQVNNSSEGNAAYNTIVNPKGSKVIDITLADGTKVWLNSGSSLRFPVAFTQKERKVELTGEVYFEVKKNTTMPFIAVVNSRQQVEVLGTHFNINAFDDEATINTTLLEGAVKVKSLSSNNSTAITPGQQAQLSAKGEISLNNKANTDEVMAWKNGLFYFTNADTKTIMRQLGRWYNVEVEFKGNENKQATYTGKIGRDLSLTSVLKGLGSTRIKYTITGTPDAVKKIVVYL
jgi:transmembrane sensor